MLLCPWLHFIEVCEEQILLLVVLACVVAKIEAVLWVAPVHRHVSLALGCALQVHGDLTRRDRVVVNGIRHLL